MYHQLPLNVIATTVIRKKSRAFALDVFDGWPGIAVSCRAHSSLSSIHRHCSFRSAHSFHFSLHTLNFDTSPHFTLYFHRCFFDLSACAQTLRLMSQSKTSDSPSFERLTDRSVLTSGMWTNLCCHNLFSFHLLNYSVDFECVHAVFKHAHHMYIG
jgi:hypothetical protein